jgi:diaminopimelate decarboxylase
VNAEVDLLTRGDAAISEWNLVRRDGELQWDGCSLGALAERHGTPLYVIHGGILKNCHDSLREYFRREGLETKMYFSCKTNPVPAVLKRLASWGCGVEVISEFEFWLARK